MKKLQVTLMLFFVTAAVFAARSQYTLDNLPSPKTKGQEFFVSNPDGILSSSTVASLNAICRNIDSAMGVEIAVVAVDDFKGADVFEFAYALFNQWGIGKKGSNNGLLLFFAEERREYRFVTGSGLEGILPDAALKQIGENYLVPYFKANDYDAGVMEAIHSVKQVLLASDHRAELKSLLAKRPSFWQKNRTTINSLGWVIALFTAAYFWLSFAKKYVLKDFKVAPLKQKASPFVTGCSVFVMLMFFSIFVFVFVFNNAEQVFRFHNLPIFLAILGSVILAVQYFSAQEKIKAASRDEYTVSAMLAKYNLLAAVVLLVVPLAYWSIYAAFRRKAQSAERLVPPDDSGNWERLNRDNIYRNQKKYLTEGRLAEEKIKSQAYEVWQNKTTNKIEIKAFRGARFRRYTLCPKCSHQTFSKPFTETIQSATYSREGKGERLKKCSFCNYKESLGFVVIPKKVRSTSGSGSGSGTSSSSGSSGSFGGGSSSGGGAGGRW